MSAMDDAIWTSLPVPALMLDEADRIARINPAAEGFLMSSARALIGQPVWDRLAVDAPLEEALDRARRHDAPLFVNDVDVGTGDRAPVQCTLQIAPLAGQAGKMLLLISPRELAGGSRRTSRSNPPRVRPSVWRKCWRMKSRTRSRGSPVRRSFCRWASRPMTWN